MSLSLLSSTNDYHSSPNGSIVGKRITSFSKILAGKLSEKSPVNLLLDKKNFKHNQSKKQNQEQLVTPQNKPTVKTICSTTKAKVDKKVFDFDNIAPKVKRKQRSKSIKNLKKNSVTNVQVKRQSDGVSPNVKNLMTKTLKKHTKNKNRLLEEKLDQEEQKQKKKLKLMQLNRKIRHKNSSITKANNTLSPKSYQRIQKTNKTLSCMDQSDLKISEEKKQIYRQQVKSEGRKRIGLEFMPWMKPKKIDKQVQKDNIKRKKTYIPGRTANQIKKIMRKQKNLWKIKEFQFEKDKQIQEFKRVSGLIKLQSKNIAKSAQPRTSKIQNFHVPKQDKSIKVVEKSYPNTFEDVIMSKSIDSQTLAHKLNDIRQNLLWQQDNIEREQAAIKIQKWFRRIKAKRASIPIQNVFTNIKETVDNSYQQIKNQFQLNEQNIQQFLDQLESTNENNTLSQVIPETDNKPQAQTSKEEGINQIDGSFSLSQSYSMSDTNSDNQNLNIFYSQAYDIKTDNSIQYIYTYSSSHETSQELMEVSYICLNKPVTSLFEMMLSFNTSNLDKFDPRDSIQKQITVTESSEEEFNSIEYPSLEELLIQKHQDKKQSIVVEKFPDAIKHDVLDDSEFCRKVELIYDVDQSIELIVQQEIKWFLNVTMNQSPKEVDNSQKFIKQYLNKFRSELQFNQEQFLDIFNSPIPLDELDYLEYIQETQILENYPQFEIIAPTQLNNKLSKYFDRQSKPLCRLYCHMLFDAINESMNYIRPYGVFGAPSSWSFQSPIVKIQNNVENIFNKIQKQILDWESIRAGYIFHSSLLFSGIEAKEVELNEIREDKLSNLLCHDAISEEYQWTRYEDEEIQVICDLGDLIFTKICDEIIELLDN